MTVTINRHATTIEQRVLNRTRHEFEGAQDLLVQALPVLYDDGWLDMYVTYLEPLPRALRPLDQSVRIEAQMPQRHDSVEETFQGKRRRYVIRVTALHARRADADRD